MTRDKIECEIDRLTRLDVLNSEQAMQLARAMQEAKPIAKAGDQQLQAKWCMAAGWLLNWVCEAADCEPVHVVRGAMASRQIYAELAEDQSRSN